MPVEIGWLIPQRVSYFRYIGDVTIEEVTEASNIGLQLLNESTHVLVHSIQDSRDMVSFPNNVAAVMKSVQQSLSAPRMGWLLSVGVENDLIRFVARMVTKITRIRHRLFAEMQETKAFLAYVDTTLPSLDAFTLPDDVTILYRVNSSESELVNLVREKN